MPFSNNNYLADQLSSRSDRSTAPRSLSHQDEKHNFEAENKQPLDNPGGSSYKQRNRPYSKKSSMVEEGVTGRSNSARIPVIPPIPGGQKYSMQDLLEMGESLKNDKVFVESEKSDLYHTILPISATSTKILYDDNEDILHEMAHGMLRKDIRKPPTHSANFGAGYESAPLPSLWNPVLDKQSSFNQTPSSSNASPFVTKSPMVPPGLSPNMGQPSVMYADRIMWLYKDSSGVEQGPFNGIMMHGWYKDNWLPDHLVMRRAEDTEFITLAQFKAAVGNSASPFMVPLPPVIPRTRSIQSNEPLPLSPTNAMLGSWNQHTFSKWSPLTGSHASAPAPLGTQSTSAIGTPISGRSPRTSLADVFQDAKIDSGHSVRTDSDVQSGFRVADSGKTNETNTEQISAPITDVQVIKESEIVQNEPTELMHNVKASSPLANEVFVSQQQQKPEEPKPVEPAVPEAIQIPEEVTKKVAECEESQARNEPSESAVEDTSAGLQPFAPPVEPPSPVKAQKPKPLTSVAAPWSNASPVSKVSPISLEDVQSARKKKQQEKKKQEKTAALAAAANTDIDLSELSTQLPAKPVVSAPWAFVAPKAPVKTLSEIQKEQLEAKKKMESKKVPDSSVLSTPGGKSYASVLGKTPVTVLRRPQEISVPSTVRRKSVESTAIQHEEIGDEWTTVKSSKRTVNSPSTNGPEHSRAVPLVRNPATPTKVSGTLLDFIHWCKTSIRGLNPGVNQKELLNMLVSLPAATDSKDIIADIVYSNSSTMDGRRFAEEFLKRRQKIGDSFKITDFKRAITDQSSEFHVVRRK